MDINTPILSSFFDMSPIRLTVLLLISTLLLTSCFEAKQTGQNTTPSDGKAPLEKPIDMTPQAVEQAAVEQQRVMKLDSLTPDNLTTQVETKDGKKILKDRRLFVNFIKSEKVDSSAKLIAALEKVESFTKKNNLDLRDSDILVMIAGSQTENVSWNICGNFNATKKDLDSKNKYYGHIDKLCNPQAPPKAK